MSPEEKEILASMFEVEPASTETIKGMEAKATTLIDAEPPIHLQEHSYVNHETGAMVHFTRKSFEETPDGPSDIAITLGREYDESVKVFAMVFSADNSLESIGVEPEDCSELPNSIAAANELLRDVEMDSRAVAIVAHVKQCMLLILHAVEIEADGVEQALHFVGADHIADLTRSMIPDYTGGRMQIMRELNKKVDDNHKLTVIKNDLVGVVDPDEALPLALSVILEDRTNNISHRYAIDFDGTRTLETAPLYEYEFDETVYEPEEGEEEAVSEEVTKKLREALNVDVICATRANLILGALAVISDAKDTSS